MSAQLLTVFINHFCITLLVHVQVVAMVSQSSDTKKRTTTVTLAEALSTGVPAVLSLTFKGILNDNMAGFYRCGKSTIFSYLF